MPPAVNWRQIQGAIRQQLKAGLVLPGDYEVLYKPVPLLNGDVIFRPDFADNETDLYRRYITACRDGAKDFTFELSGIFRYIERPTGPICFGGDGEALLSDGQHKRIRDLVVGDSVKLPGPGSSAASIVAVWRARVERPIPMASLLGVKLTPDHPVCVGGAWRRPDELVKPCVAFVDAVYNFALSEGHSLLVRALGCGPTAHVHCCTLGKPVPGIPEPLWGSDQIFEELVTLPGYPNVETVM